MPSNKNLKRFKGATSLPVRVPAQKELVEWCEKADASNLERGLLSLPVELTTEILDYFPTIGPYNEVFFFMFNSIPILPELYRVRIDVLRALSQVCIDYRRIFLPLLWDSLNMCCFTMRKAITGWKEYIPEALIRNCDGLSTNPNLASYIG
jgi:hypothetical protein